MGKALFQATPPVYYNSAFGFLSLLSNADANFNTGVGAGVLLTNTASNNTAVGAGALFTNTTGGSNSALGPSPCGLTLKAATTTQWVTSHCSTMSLVHSTTPMGASALNANTDGSENNAFGDLALTSNVSGSGNTAIGDDALFNATGDSNVGVGDEAGNSITTGSNNTCVGAGAGVGIVDGTDIIAIGTPAAGIFANFGPTCFIGGINEPTGDPGTYRSSTYRFK